MIRNNHAREGGCNGDKEAKRDKAGRLVKSDRIYCLGERFLTKNEQRRHRNFFGSTFDQTVWFVSFTPMISERSLLELFHFVTISGTEVNSRRLTEPFC